MLQTIIQDLSKNLKIETPTSTNNNEFIFFFDNTLKITLTSNKKDSIIITSPIYDLKTINNNKNNKIENNAKTEKLLKELLEINFTRLKNQEETLTWDPDSDQIILFKEIPQSTLSEHPMLHQLEKFLNTLEFWKSIIAQKTTPKSTPPPPTP